MKENDQDKKWIPKSLAIAPALMFGGSFFLWQRITDSSSGSLLLNHIGGAIAILCLWALFFIFYANIVQQQKQIDKLKSLVKDSETGIIDHESLASS